MQHTETRPGAKRANSKPGARIVLNPQLSRHIQPLRIEDNPRPVLPDESGVPPLLEFKLQLVRSCAQA